MLHVIPCRRGRHPLFGDFRSPIQFHWSGWLRTIFSISITNRRALVRRVRLPVVALNEPDLGFDVKRQPVPRIADHEEGQHRGAGALGDSNRAPWGTGARRPRKFTSTPAVLNSSGIIRTISFRRSALMICTTDSRLGRAGMMLDAGPGAIFALQRGRIAVPATA